jgi:AbrB family looped-hinge helix DNA binding protein
MDALIPVDGRGQIVLPKELRVKAGIEAGDKLAVVSCEDGGEVCCILLLRSGRLADMVKDLLGPTMREILGGTP